MKERAREAAREKLLSPGVVEPNIPARICSQGPLEHHVLRKCLATSLQARSVKTEEMREIALMLQFFCNFSFLKTCLWVRENKLKLHEMPSLSASFLLQLSISYSKMEAVKNKFCWRKTSSDLKTDLICMNRKSVIYHQFRSEYIFHFILIICEWFWQAL